jgi:hypothetical protein
MIDFDLEKPIEQVIKEFLDICTQHVVDCNCRHCITLECLMVAAGINND